MEDDLSMDKLLASKCRMAASCLIRPIVLHRVWGPESCVGHDCPGYEPRFRQLHRDLRDNVVNEII